MANRPQKKIIRKEFELFLKREVPRQVESLGDDHARCFIEIFSYVKKPMKIIGSPGDDLKTWFYYPVGKVVNIGSEFAKGSGTFHERLQVGDIVRLADHNFTTYANPDYAVWNENEFSKSNLKDKQIGQAPPKYISMISHLNRQMFSFDVFGGDGTSEIYFLEVPQIVAPVIDVEKLF